MIDTQFLKSRIMDLALRGDLIQQFEAYGNASELIEKCGVREKFEIEEAPYEIPSSWRWCKFSDIVDFHLGKTPARASKLYWDEGIYPWISISDISDNGKVYSTKEKITQRACDECFGKGISKAGTLIMSFKLTIGKVAILDRDAFHNEAIISIIPKYDDGNVFRNYLFWCLPTVAKSTKSHGAIKGDTLNKTSLSNMKVPIPPLLEQVKIVEKLEEIFAQIALIDELQNQYSSDIEALKSKIIDAGIQGELTEQLPEDGTAEELLKKIADEKKKLIKEKKMKATKELPNITADELPFVIPATWKFVRIGDVCELNPKNDLSDDTEVSFIPMACVTEGYNNKHTFEIKKWGEIKKGFNHFQNNDVGVAKITPCFQNRKSVVFRDLLEGYGAGTTELSIVRGYAGMICPDYLLWFFKSAYFINNGIESFTGVVGQQRIHKDYLKMCVLPLPPYAEQLRIVDMINGAITAVENI